MLREKTIRRALKKKIDKALASLPNNLGKKQIAIFPIEPSDNIYSDGTRLFVIKEVYSRLEKLGFTPHLIYPEGETRTFFGVRSIQ